MGYHVPAYAADTTHLDPRCLYTRSGFMKASGISQSRIAEARRDGIELPAIREGRRMFIRGADAIAYIERLAERSCEQPAS